MIKMLTEKQVSEIREHLEKAQNPLFFFDNDDDGLTSFLLLRRYIGRGKGVAIRSYPDLSENYARKLHELNPDYVFVLDKPEISEGFLNEAREMNLPLVWIDHHNVPKPKNKEIYYFNPYHNDKTNEPIAYLCYKIIGGEEDLWLAMAGCIGDNYFPDFVKEFEKRYPELWGRKIKTAFQALYTTEIGKIARILNFSLKDRTTKVVNMLKFLSAVKGPHDVLDEEKARAILQRFKQVNDKYSKWVEKAKKFAKGDLLFFQYGGELSLSADISNELSFLYPDKMIVVAYIKGDKANISLRWKKNVRELTLKAIEGIEGASGGGHEHATGAKVSAEDLPRFKENLMKLIKG